jgi:O-antigen/teichoic acid export membrane protein
MAQTLKERTTIALIWSFIDRFGQQLIYFITGIYLARVLSVDDYGLMGSLIFFSALSISIIGSGYSRALINKKTVDPSDYQSVFIYNAVTAVLFYFLLFFSAPAIAQFFGQPQLVQLARVMFLGVLFTALQIVQETSLSKNMDLNRIARSNIFGLLPASILAIIAAHHG